jgi:uncharacterized protein with PIN domain
MAPRFVAALALLALIALTSTADLGGDQPLSVAELALALTALAVGAMLAIGVGTVAYGGGYAIFGGNRRRTNLIAGLLIAALLAAIIALAFAPIDFWIEEHRGTETVQPSGAGVTGEGEGGGGGDDDLAIAAALVAGGALLAALLVGLLALLARRRAEVAAVEEEQVVIEAVEESLEDLRRERDVRRAIIACYARMERALEHAGSARRPAEAPFEYLVRVLERITANGPAARALTELFERAKFSVEPVGDREKQQAIDALELLRVEVSRPL